MLLFCISALAEKNIKDDCISHILGNHLTHTFIFVHMCELHSRIFSLSQARGRRCALVQFT